MKYRLGLDLGTNSIGWTMLLLDENNEPKSIVKMGSRIFHDGRTEKNKQPLAVQRRAARGMRRNLDRKKQRKYALLSFLTKNGLFPEGEEERKILSKLNPYKLRATAIHEKLTLWELGRIFLHFSSRRGFKSNRKYDKKNKESGKVSEGIKKLSAILQRENCKTLGEYFYLLKEKGESVRCRIAKTEDNKNVYDKYVERSMLEAEFKAIVEFQLPFKELTKETVDGIFHILFDQRPLKPQVVGKCPIFSQEYRISKAHVMAQDFVLLQKINDLRVWTNEGYSERPLTNQEKNVLKSELRYKKEQTYNQIRKLFARKIISCGEKIEYGIFSHERKPDDELAGNVTNYLMVSKNCFGEEWKSFPDELRFDIIEKLLSNEKDEDIVKYLLDTFHLPAENVKNIIGAKIPDGYLRYGKTAVSTLVKIMDEKNVDKYTAEQEAVFLEKEYSGCFDSLPYYAIPLETHVVPGTGEVDANDEVKYGKIANPTVHIALNQLRKVVNELIEIYGKPYQIVAEIGRELKLSKKQKDDIDAANKENQKNNEKYKQELEEIGIQNNYDNRLRLKLWYEMPEINRSCVYSGAQISKRDLFSGKIDIDHILPFSRTLDDGIGNKVLCVHSANAFKSNKTPYEAFKDNPNGYDYGEILKRASEFFRENKSKLNKFADDAMKRYTENVDFIARQLTDMQYLSKCAKEYLKVILEDANDIWVIPGRLTSMLRAKYGLNSILSGDSEKNRNDHRHHAIDALVVSLTSRSLLQKIATLSGKNDKEGSDRIIAKLQEPWDKFRLSVEKAVDEIRVSHKPDHGIEGALHEDTAYGIVENGDKAMGNLVRRKPVRDMSGNEFALTRDKTIREAIEQFQTLEEKREYLNEKRIRRLRLLKKDAPIIPIKDEFGRVYKAFVGGSNLCLEVYEEGGGRKNFEVVQLFDANQKGFKPKWLNEKPDAKLLYRLFKGDVLKFKDNDGRSVCGRITSIWQIQLVMLPLNEGGKRGEREKTEGKQIYIYKNFNPLFNVIDAKPISVSATGRISKRRFSSIDFWDR